jgi:hypothetical protein
MAAIDDLRGAFASEQNELRAQNAALSGQVQTVLTTHHWRDAHMQGEYNNVFILRASAISSGATDIVKQCDERIQMMIYANKTGEMHLLRYMDQQHGVDGNVVAKFADARKNLRKFANDTRTTCTLLGTQLSASPFGAGAGLGASAGGFGSAAPSFGGTGYGSALGGFGAMQQRPMFSAPPLQLTTAGGYAMGAMQPQHVEQPPSVGGPPPGQQLHLPLPNLSVKRGAGNTLIGVDSLTAGTKPIRPLNPADNREGPGRNFLSPPASASVGGRGRCSVACDVCNVQGHFAFECPTARGWYSKGFVTEWLQPTQQTPP